jgi:hypothetical protein
LLQGSAGAVAAQSFLGALAALSMHPARAAPGKQTELAASPYGPVAPVPDGSTGLPLLALPQGFEYKSFGWTGDPMADARPTPGNHDGMAVIRSHQGGLLLVRNHERGLVPTAAEAIRAPRVYSTGLVNGIVTLPYGPVTIRIGASGTVVDPAAPPPDPFVGYAAGGTTNLVVQGNTWRGAAGSLGGTLANCAGGPTPWGSWLSCEETLYDFSGIGGKRHGYVFEVAADPARTIAEPIVGMGRIVHEAVAIDPASGYVYETEDNRNLSSLFRYKPGNTSGQVGSLHGGGVLQAARVKRIVRQTRPASLSATNDTRLLDPDIGDEYEMEWVDIADPDAGPLVVAGQPGGVSLGIMSGPSFQARSRGCARISRGEGIWYSAGRLFIVDTAAGVDGDNRPGRGDGGVWELNLRSMHLKALYVSGNAIAGNNPDNVTVSSRGGVVLCEDGGFGRDGCRVLALNRQGEAYEFCRSLVQLSSEQIAAAGKTIPPGDYRGFEFCGACFDPRGLMLFFNILNPGITFAIKGPWRRGNL